jgi:PAS domain S-box-containing protein
MRSTGDSLMRVARMMHEHTGKLEVAIEGTYASDSGDPRIRLLSESLRVSSIADQELGKITQSLQRVLSQMQAPTNGSTPGQVGGVSEREREALTISISTLKKERNELETLYGIAQVLNSTLKFDEVLRTVMDQVIEVVNAERGFLMLVNPATNTLEFTIARDKEAKPIPESAFSMISRSTVNRVMQTRTAMLADDAMMDASLQAQASILTNRIRSMLCAPLVVRNVCIGVVYVDSRITANLFGPKHLELLLAFCNQAAIAIDNARLFTRVNEDKQYMDNIFASIENGVITTDASGIIKTFNRAARNILKLDPAAVLGRHYQDVFRTLPQLGLSELLQRSFSLHEHGTIVPTSVDAEIADRGSVNLTFHVSSLRDEGAFIGMALVVDDRTELKRAEAQAKQVRRIFERYVHPNVVQQLMKDPMAINLGGETKEISVIFADIRGFTRLSENMAPEEVMNLLNRYLKIMCEAVWEEEGTLTAFLGDALMAIFNAPLEQKTHALKAVRAGWKMRMAILEYQRTQPQETLVSFGIGVNTGLATVGNLGSQERMQNYTAIGDVVNVASRLQNNVTDNKILLNESTYMQVYRSVQVGQAFPLQVKNKTAPLNVRYLVGLV